MLNQLAAQTPTKKGKPKGKKTKQSPAQEVFAFLNPSREEKNKFEEVIDELMHSEAVAKFPELSEITAKAYKNPAERRQAILSRLDNNRSLFFKINQRIGTKSRLSPMELVEEILLMLREYIKVGETERKLYGEVMTPISLVEEMLDGLPTEVWSNPELKWLDPANGCGIFPAVILKRLMLGLEAWEPNEEKRYKHIMEKMLHVCELQPKNMFIYLCAFDPKDQYALNIYTGSFLTEGFNKHSQEIWGVEKFDVIVGNPPYHKDSANGKKTNPIWHLFVEEAISIVSINGFLNFVHPSGWRAVSGRFDKLRDKIKELDILTLTICDAKKGKEVFGASTRFDYYTLQNSQSSRTTYVTWQDGSNTSEVLRNLPFIPNERLDEIKKLLAGKNCKTVRVIHSYASYETRKDHMSKVQTTTHKYPCIDNVDINGLPSKVYWSNTDKKGHFGEPKLITGSFGINIFEDKAGNHGMTQHSIGIIEAPENLEQLKAVLLSDKFRAISDAMNVGGLRECIDKKVIALFRKDFWKEFI